MGSDGPAEGIQLANPNSVAVDKEYLYILDGANQRVLRVALSEMLDRDKLSVQERHR